MEDAWSTFALYIIILSDPHEAEVTVWFRLLPHVGKVVGHLDQPHAFGGTGGVQFSRRLLALTALLGRTSHDPLDSMEEAATLFNAHQHMSIPYQTTSNSYKPIITGYVYNHIHKV